MPAGLMLVVLVLFAGGCHRKARVGEPDTYRYAISVMAPFKDFTLRLNGQPLAATNDEFVIPKNVRLSDPNTKLTAARATSCVPASLCTKSGKSAVRLVRLTKPHP